MKEVLVLGAGLSCSSLIKYLLQNAEEESWSIIIADYNLELANDGLSLIYAYNSQAKQTGITNLLQDIREAGMKLSDLNTEQGTLEDIFVSLVNKEKK